MSAVTHSHHGIRRHGAMLLGVLAFVSIAGCTQPDDTVARAGEDSAAPRPGPAADPGAPAAQAGADALAVIAPGPDRRVSGTAEFHREDDGRLAIHLELHGLEPGRHGVHIHETGDCSAPDQSSAGDHFAPDGDPHGSPDAANDAHHAGDLGNVVADSSGPVVMDWVDDELSLDGTYGVIGRAVIVHAQADDLTTQPSGDSGDPIACGVILSVNGDAARL